MSRRSLAIRVTAFAFMCGTVAACHAYEADVHFNLTYALARLASMSDEEALTVASADQRMDENSTTVAEMVLATDPNGFEARKRRTWHALDDSREQVLAQKAVLWKRALEQKSLVALGQYFHFLQDHYSHREVKGKDWRPFGWRAGHGAVGHQPDRVPSDIPQAIEMADATLADTREFVIKALGRTPADVPAGATKKLVEALAKCYGRDMLQFWNRAREEKVPVELSAALHGLFPNDPADRWKVPHHDKIMPLKFKEDGSVAS